MSGDGRRERRRFALWTGGALVLLLPLWWWVGADLVAGLCRPLAALVGLAFGLTDFTVVDGEWRIRTAFTSQGAPLIMRVSPEQTRRFLLSLPIFAALLLAPPRSRLTARTVLIPVACLLLVFALSPTVLVYGELTSLLDPTRAVSQGVALDQPPLPDVVAQVAILGRYLVLAILPLLAPVVAWATINPEARRLFFGAFGDPEQVRS